MKKVYIVIVLTFFSSLYSVFYAQTPTITSFTPTAGPVGTSVIITGTSFNAIPANNVVWFGATRAAVTAGSSTQLTVTVPIGATYQSISITDITNGFTAQSKIPFTVTFPSSRIIEVPALATKVDFITGTAPRGVAVGDLDGDGKPDLAIVNGTSNSVSVYRNVSVSGTISSGSFAPRVDFTTGSSPFGILIKDLEGDGKSDIVVTNNSSNTVSILRNTSSSGSITSGSFAAKVDFATAASPRDLASYDLDGDGKQDLVIACGGSVSVLRNTGSASAITSGSFAAKVDFTSGGTSYCVAIGDIDGDSKPDIAVSNYAVSTVSVFRNTSISGNITTGSFNAKVDFNTGAYCYGLAFNDIDQDGKPDMIVVNNLGNSISLFKNTSIAGDIVAGSFGTRVDLDCGSSGPKYISLGDIDGDGKPDLAVTNNTGASIFRNISTSGIITTGSFMPKVDFITGANSDAIVVGDIDGDGKPDLALTSSANNSVSALRNMIPNAPPNIVAISSFTPVSGPTGTSVTINGTNFNTTPANNIVWFGAARAVVTASTVTQLTVTVPSGATFQPITVTDIITGLTAQSKISYTVTFPSSRIIEVPALATKVDFSTGTAPHGVAVGDLDGDGKPDLAVANGSSNTVSVYRNISVSGTISAGSFSPRVDFATSGSPYGVLIRDIEGDGKPDIIVTNNSTDYVSILRNTSSSGSITASSFAGKVDFPTGDSPRYIGCDDLDGDGKPDLVIACNGFVSVLRNSGSSSGITTATFASKADFATAGTSYCVAIGDIDGDGKPDLAVTNYSNNSISVIRNQCTAGIITGSSFASHVDFSTGGGPYGIALNDIDADAKPDMIVVNNAGNSVSLFKNTCTAGDIVTGSFSVGLDLACGATGPRFISLGDIDGDGKPDIAVTNSTGASIFRNIFTSGALGADSFMPKVDFITGVISDAIISGDIDGDGKPDLTLANSTNNSVSVLRNVIASTSTNIITISSFTPTSGHVGASITINGTNFNPTASNNIVWFGSTRASVIAATSTQLTVTVPVGASYQPIAITDLATGLTAYSKIPFNVTFVSSQIIDGDALASKIDFSTGSSPHGAAIGDFDGDGKPDLAVANASINTVSVYRNISVTGSITSGSFGPRVDFATGGSPYGILVTDIEGDGKPDLIISNNSGNSISVLRNTSISGPFTSGTFADKVDFSCGNSPREIESSDIDKDGKPDLVVVCAGTFSVLRNAGSSAGITAASFSSGVTFISGGSSYCIAIGDIDGDGKADLAVPSAGGNTVAVFRNTSIPGIITAGSFASKIDFGTGSNPRGIALTDIDEDGKPDMIVVNNSGNSVSVFRNTSVSGSIVSGSFDSKTDFSCGSTSPEFISVGDIDGDGKPDISVSNNTGLSIFKNVCIPGNLRSDSFLPKADFITGSHTDAIAINDIDGDNKPDLTIVSSANTSVSVMQNIISETISNIVSISSFTPAFGPTGSSVTINGTNFNTTAANNIVQFGAVKATVSAATATQLTVSVPAGATYQPITVTADGLSAYSNMPFTVTFSGPRIINSGTFSPAINISTGASPYFTCIEDIDGDSKPDLVVPNYNANTISIYRNVSAAGSITTGSFSSPVNFTTGTGPWSVAFGDIDGDGKKDMAVTNYSGNSVSIFRNISSSGSISTGSFGTRVDFSTSTNPTGLVIGDLDRDGRPDLVVTNNGSNKISVFKNQSSPGSITSGSLANKVEFNTGSNPMIVALSDVDGDSKPDLAVTNLNSNTVSVFRNTATIGSISSGSFASKVDFTTGNNPFGVSFGDIDGDGKPDLVVTNNGSSSTSVFRNTSSTGSITTSSFSSKIDFTVGTQPYNISLCDIDGDGKPDLAVANYISNTISLLRNTSTSGVINTSSFSVKFDITTGTGPINVAVADLDGDGRPDLAYANSTGNTMSVLRNNITAPPAITSFSPASGPIGTSITITGANFNSTPANNIVWFGAVKATVTAATGTQLTVTVPTGATYQPISVTSSSTGLTGYSNSVFNITFPSSRLIDATSFSTPVTLAAGSNPPFMAIGDIDGDGKPDLIYTNQSDNNVSIRRNISSSGSITAGSFSASVNYLTGSSTAPYGVTLGDIDGDGKLDLAIANYNTSTISVFRNASTSGTVAFDAKIDFATSSTPHTVAIADIDGDGKPDLVVPCYNGGVISVLLNTGSSGSITTGSFAPKVDFTAGSGPRNIAVGDIDGDGKPDVVVSNTSSGNVSVFRNTSSQGVINSGTFATNLDLATGSTPVPVAISDLDGDGKADLLVGNAASNNVSVFRNVSSSGSITSGSFSAKTDFSTGVYPTNLTLSDLDGDGKPDLILANGNSVSVLRNISSPGFILNGSLAARTDFTTASALGLAVGDLDGDGQPDIAITNSPGSNISIFRNTMLPASAPVIGTIAQPTCNTATGSVTLNGLPASGSWTISILPGTITSTGSGLTANIGNLAPGTYTFTVTNASGITSAESSPVTIIPPASAPSIPGVGILTQPTCTIPTGGVILDGLPATGTWTLTKSPGGTTSTGTGISTSISGLAPGTYTYTVTNVAGCISGSTGNIVILNNPQTPSSPEVGIVMQPSCSVSTGSVILNSLPATGSWTLTRSPGGNTTSGTGTSTTITGLNSGTYTYTVTNTSGCVSASSANVSINASSSNQAAPNIGTITQPTCNLATGSVVLTGLPNGWTITRKPDGAITSGSVPTATISGLPAGTYTFSVTNTEGCTSVESAEVVLSVGTGLIPKIIVKWNDVVICLNNSDSITSYKWFKGSDFTSGTGRYYVTNKQPGLYKVQTTDIGGCKNFSNAVNISSGTKGLSAYPNPARGIVTIGLTDEPKGKVVISIFNQAGIKVMELETEKENTDLLRDIPLSGLDKGIYFVQVTVNKINTYYTKVVVAK